MKTSRLVSLILCISMLIGATLCFSVVSADEKETTIIAGSDFQSKSGNSSGMKNITNILSAMSKDGIKSADGMLFCGDYDFDTHGVTESTKEGIKFVKLAAKNFVDEKNMVFVQGNHDVSAGGDLGLSQSGNNDPESGKYGVFVIHNDDYMWYNNDESRIKRTAQKLINYLNEKIETGYDKPIFVLSHLPLHYSMRTIADGDGKYACYIFDALQEAGKKGLNIIFLFGHDHSNGWDDYMGGSSVYLKKGDKILTANKSTSAKSYKELNFTYMNAGYVGYYDNNNGADDALTMTVFKIKGSEITISRYSKDGIHNLKSEGFTNKYKNEKGYDPDKTVYSSPQTVKLETPTDTTPIPELVALKDSGMQYNRVDDVSMLVSGNRYILVHNSSPDHIVMPKIATKSDNAGAKRTGLNVARTSDFGDSAAFGNFAQYEFVFTMSCGGWYIGNGQENILFTDTSDQKITATYDSVGSLFTISGTSGSFVFESGDYSFNYNARGLINGFTSDPAKFYIYEYVGYSVGVKNGSADLYGDKITYAKPGAEITVTAGEAPAGTEFAGWSVMAGGIEISDPMAKSFTFVMPEDGVKLEAVFKAVDVPSTEGDKTEPPASVLPTEAPSTTEGVNGADDGKNGTLVVVIVVAAVVVIGGAGGAAFAVKKKKTVKA